MKNRKADFARDVVFIALLTFAITALGMTCLGQDGLSETERIRLHSSSSKVHFLDQETGYRLAGSYGKSWSRLERTKDGGQTWRVVDVLHGLDPKDHVLQREFPSSHMYFINKNHGFLFGDPPSFDQHTAMIRTTDGGETWTKWKGPGGAQAGACQCMSFINEKEGFFLGRSARTMTLFRTQDGGETWKPTEAELKDAPKTWKTGEAHRPVDHTAAELIFKDASNASLVNTAGIELKSTDGGHSWTTHKTDLEPADFSNRDLRKPTIYFHANSYTNDGFGVRLHNMPNRFADEQETWTVETTWSEGMTWKVVHRFTEVKDQNGRIVRPFKSQVNLVFDNYGTGAIMGDDGTDEALPLIMRNADAHLNEWAVRSFNKPEHRFVHKSYHTIGAHIFFVLHKPGEAKAFLMHSPDRGKSWQEKSLDWGKNQRVHEFEFNHQDWRISFAVPGPELKTVTFQSKDNGLTWSEKPEHEYYTPKR